MDFEKIATAIEKSSPEIKNLLFSEEIGNFLQDLAQKNNLNEETSLKLIDEIGYLILGLKERSTIKSSLANIGVPKESILSIIQEISRKIFSELDKIEDKTKISKNQQKPKEVKSENKDPEPIIITKDTKENAMIELNRRVEEQEKVKPLTPEIKPDIHPMIEPGETARDVPTQSFAERKDKIPFQAPKSSYLGS